MDIALTSLNLKKKALRNQQKHTSSTRDDEVCQDIPPTGLFVDFSMFVRFSIYRVPRTSPARWWCWRVAFPISVCMCIGDFPKEIDEHFIRINLNQQTIKQFNCRSETENKQNNKEIGGKPQQSDKRIVWVLLTGKRETKKIGEIRMMGCQ